MSCAITRTCDSPEGTAVTIRALIRNPATGANLVIADVASATVKVRDLFTEVESGDFTLVVASTFFSTLQTGGGWSSPTGDGFNFRYVVPASAFPDGNREYRMTLTATDTNGNAIRHQWDHKTTEVLGE